MELFYSIKGIWLVLIYLSCIAAAQQKPLNDHETAPLSAQQWNFNFSSSAPHYFASAYGLLQQWSNTFFPNGHSIVPCEIPPLTKLYHGRKDAEVPPSPEWIAFDMQVPIYSNERSSADQVQWNGVWHHGRRQEFAHADLSNDTEDEMHIF
jgi:hypothetical protein